MNFEWDEDKSSACYRLRGFDFAYAAFAFADPDRIIRQDNRFSYGEDRYELIGRIEGRLCVLIYTPRHDGIRIILARKANPREVKLTMKTVSMKIDVQSPSANPVGRIDAKRVDATTEADIAKHQAEDDANAMLDAAKFARRVRRRLGFSQVEFAERIDVSLDTIRNWEQGKRCPTGAAKALLKVLDKAPEAALAALH